MYPLQLVLRDILLQNQAGNMLNVVTDAAYAERMMSRMGLKYAVIVISTIPILAVYPFAQKFFTKGVMIGSVKG
jgi:putative aldouronate transport system permease protein